MILNGIIRLNSQSILLIVYGHFGSYSKYTIYLSSITIAYLNTLTVITDPTI